MRSATGHASSGIARPRSLAGARRSRRSSAPRAAIARASQRPPASTGRPFADRDRAYDSRTSAWCASPIQPAASAKRHPRSRSSEDTRPARHASGPPAHASTRTSSRPTPGPSVARGPDRLSALLDETARELVPARRERLLRPEERARSLVGRHPRALAARGGRALERLVEVLGPGARDLSEVGAGELVRDADRVARGAGFAREDEGLHGGLPIGAGRRAPDPLRPFRRRCLTDRRARTSLEPLRRPGPVARPRTDKKSSWVRGKRSPGAELRSRTTGRLPRKPETIDALSTGSNAIRHLLAIRFAGPLARRANNVGARTVEWDRAPQEKSQLQVAVDASRAGGSRSASR